jgi:lipopolysaccharide/colanic/teichoic acid biosynthesis glycosyltransferase
LASRVTFSPTARIQTLRARPGAVPSVRSADPQAGQLAPGIEAPVPVRGPRPAYDAAKRAVDVVVAAVALIVLAPSMALIALLIRLDSPGPALFTQQRVGLGGRTFTFYKFRSMYVDSRERFPERFDVQAGDEASMFYKQPDDPRVTPVGRFLRSSSLDELPNLFNVLRGDMSLVGPRPELLEFVRYYSPWQLAKFSVRSGVTGHAQTSGRGTLTVHEQIGADLEYVLRQSLWFDLVILARTVKMVVLGVGAF